ncbi:hypothetical protein [Paracandidimonas soli]|uniref:hypothetical protein n=1 Tax=Paracandidimonas soli TaxID=1917182 RepID=UPI00334093CE
MKKHRISRVSIAVLALSVSGSAAAAWTDLDLNSNGNVNNEPFQGSFTFVIDDANGNPVSSTTYGPTGSGASNTVFDLDLLDRFVLYGKNGAGGHGHNDDVDHLVSNDGTYPVYPGAPVVYRMYRQNYSAAVVNLSRGTGPRDFVKSVVGQETATNPYVLNGEYKYAGIAFTNFPRGDFDYTVTVSGGSNVVGEGSFSLREVKIPASQSSTGLDIFFDITNGVLEQAALNTSGGITFAGDVTIDPTTGVSDSGAWAEVVNADPNYGDPTYSLTVYGPNGQEIAGAIQGLPSRVGSAAIIGELKSQP